MELLHYTIPAATTFLLCQLVAGARDTIQDWKLRWSHLTNAIEPGLSKRIMNV